MAIILEILPHAQEYGVSGEVVLGLFVAFVGDGGADFGRGFSKSFVHAAADFESVLAIATEQGAYFVGVFAFALLVGEDFAFCIKEKFVFERGGEASCLIGHVLFAQDYPLAILILHFADKAFERI